MDVGRRYSIEHNWSGKASVVSQASGNRRLRISRSNLLPSARRTAEPVEYVEGRQPDEFPRSVSSIPLPAEQSVDGEAPAWVRALREQEKLLVARMRRIRRRGPLSVASSRSVVNRSVIEMPDSSYLPPRPPGAYTESHRAQRRELPIPWSDEHLAAAPPVDRSDIVSVRSHQQSFHHTQRFGSDLQPEQDVNVSQCVYKPSSFDIHHEPRALHPQSPFATLPQDASGCLPSVDTVRMVSGEQTPVVLSKTINERKNSSLSSMNAVPTSGVAGVGLYISQSENGGAAESILLTGSDSNLLTRTQHHATEPPETLGAVFNSDVKVDRPVNSTFAATSAAFPAAGVGPVASMEPTFDSVTVIPDGRARDGNEPSHLKAEPCPLTSVGYTKSSSPTGSSGIAGISIGPAIQIQRESPQARDTGSFKDLMTHEQGPGIPLPALNELCRNQHAQVAYKGSDQVDAGASVARVDWIHSESHQPRSTIPSFKNTETVQPPFMQPGMRINFPEEAMQADDQDSARVDGVRRHTPVSDARPQASPPQQKASDFFAARRHPNSELSTTMITRLEELSGQVAAATTALDEYFRMSAKRLPTAEPKSSREPAMKAVSALSSHLVASNDAVVAPLTGLVERFDRICERIDQTEQKSEAEAQVSVERINSAVQQSIHSISMLMTNITETLRGAACRAEAVLKDAECRISAIEAKCNLSEFQVHTPPSSHVSLSPSCKDLRSYRRATWNHHMALKVDVERSVADETREYCRLLDAIVDRSAYVSVSKPGQDNAASESVTGPVSGNTAGRTEAPSMITQRVEAATGNESFSGVVLSPAQLPEAPSSCLNVYSKQDTETTQSYFQNKTAVQAVNLPVVDLSEKTACPELQSSTFAPSVFGNPVENQEEVSLSLSKDLSASVSGALSTVTMKGAGDNWSSVGPHTAGVTFPANFIEPRVPDYGGEHYVAEASARGPLEKPDGIVPELHSVNARVPFPPDHVLREPCDPPNDNQGVNESLSWDENTSHMVEPKKLAWPAVSYDTAYSRPETISPALVRGSYYAPATQNDLRVLMPVATDDGSVGLDMSSLPVTSNATGLEKDVTDEPVAAERAQSNFVSTAIQDIPPEEVQSCPLQNGAFSSNGATTMLPPYDYGNPTPALQADLVTIVPTAPPDAVPAVPAATNKSAADLFEDTEEDEFDSLFFSSHM